LTDTKENKTESKADFWQHHIENCSNSSLTQAQYCREHSLALATFGYWKRRLKTNRQETACFYPLTVRSAHREKRNPSPSAGVSLHLGNGQYRISLSADFSGAALKKLIALLSEL